jgi:hypothetical protein
LNQCLCQLWSLHCGHLSYSYRHPTWADELEGELVKNLFYLLQEELLKKLYEGGELQTEWQKILL